MVEQFTLNDYYNFKVIDRYSDEELLREWQLIKDGNYGYESRSSWNKLIRTFQFYELYKNELELWHKNDLYHGLPLRSWLYANRKKYIGKGYGELTQAEILRAFKITGIHIGYSFHSPFYIKQFIKDYNIKSIYDPCGGWGHRMLGAAAADCKYIYNDINTNTALNCTNMAKFLQLSNVSFHNNDSSDFTPSEDYEAVFTCPPYHNVEIYSKDGAETFDYQHFLAWWHCTIVDSCIMKDSCKYFAFVINRTYKDDMVQYCLDEGLVQLDDILLGSTNAKSHLNSNATMSKEERLLIFKKVL